MVHLSEETLSELLDGGPAAGAEEHLSGCPVCQGELEALRQLRAELRELPELEPPPELWTRIEERLPYDGSARRSRSYFSRGTALRVAAMAAVFVIGIGLGRVFQSNDAVTGGGQPQAATVVDAMAEVQQLGSRYDAALRNLQRLAQQEGTPLRSVNEQRLVRLDMLVEASRTALAAEPADPVLNSYLFAALEERDAVLREMDAERTSGSSTMWK